MTIAYNMDCMEAMRQMPDKCFDLAVVDPPYRNSEENRPTKDMRKNVNANILMNSKVRRHLIRMLVRLSGAKKKPVHRRTNPSGSFSLTGILV